jgi:hypothetical protein
VVGSHRGWFGLVCLGGRKGGRGGSVRCDTVDALYFVVGLAGLVLRRDGDDRGADRGSGIGTTLTLNLIC